MPQLKMYWKNDGRSPIMPEAPAGCRIASFTELEEATERWLDIVQHGLSEGKQGEDFYKKVMTSNANYREEHCFFVLEGEHTVATLAVLCDYEKKEGYIHMVACKEDFRGKGYGTLLNRVAEYTLKREGMEEAYLTTDDWRIPAIKSYLRAGFVPDLSTEDFRERWEKIYAFISTQNIN